MERQAEIKFKMHGLNEQDGVLVYQDDGMGFKSFNFSNEKSPDLIKHPNGQEYFNEVKVFTNIIICELTQHIYEPEDAPKKHSIYLRKEKRWLINPEIEAGLKNEPKPKPKKDEMKILYNFFDIIDVTETYLHIACQSGGVENRVYVFKNNKWISIDYYDLIDKHLTNFDSVTKSVINNNECLILEKKGTMNPYCVFFLEEGNWLSIPNPPGMKAGDCPIFRHVFNNYVVVGFGQITLTPKLLYVFAFAHSSYAPARAPEDNLEPKENLLSCWSEDHLTENFVFYKFDEWRPPYATSTTDSRLSLYTIYRTTDWQPHKVLDQNGNLHEQVLNPRVKEGKICFEFKIEKSFGEIKL